MNAPTIGAEIPLPFGGTKHTGNGFREAGTRGIEQFSEMKTVYVDYSGRLQRAQIDNRPPLSDGAAVTMTITEAHVATDGWLERYDAAVAGVLPSYFDLVADRARGQLDHRRRRPPVPRLRLGHRRHQRRPLPPARRRGDRARRRAT